MLDECATQSTVYGPLENIANCYYWDLHINYFFQSLFFVILIDWHSIQLFVVVVEQKKDNYKLPRLYRWDTFLNEVILLISTCTIYTSPLCLFWFSVLLLSCIWMTRTIICHLKAFAQKTHLTKNYLTNPDYFITRGNGVDVSCFVSTSWKCKASFPEFENCGERSSWMTNTRARK